MRVRMLTPEKFGRLFDVPDAQAQDMIRRGVAEAFRDTVMTTASLPIETRDFEEDDAA